MKFILSFIFALLSQLIFAKSKAPSYTPNLPQPSQSEIRYGKHERNVLDFWKAESISPAPVAFVIHGGGWKGGSKERLDRFADPIALLQAGISVVAINYRYVTSDESPPVKAPLHDAARALQFVRSKAKEWNINKNRIGAAGGSAGACSSLWLAFHDDLADPKNKDPILRESSRLQCAAVTGAQTTLDPKQMKEWTPNSKYGGHASVYIPSMHSLRTARKSCPGSRNTPPMRMSRRMILRFFCSTNPPPPSDRCKRTPRTHLTSA
jgi:acetyl esterase/lipase